MPSNRELITAIHELDPGIPVGGLNNKALGEMLSVCKRVQSALAGALAKVRPGAEVDGLDLPALAGMLGDLGPDVLPEGEGVREFLERYATRPAPEYVVASGKSVTSRKGVKSAGEEVTAEMFGGGEQALDALVRSGHVDKGS